MHSSNRGLQPHASQWLPDAHYCDDIFCAKSLLIFIPWFSYRAFCVKTPCNNVCHLRHSQLKKDIRKWRVITNAYLNWRLNVSYSCFKIIGTVDGMSKNTRNTNSPLCKWCSSSCTTTLQWNNYSKKYCANNVRDNIRLAKNTIRLHHLWHRARQSSLSFGQHLWNSITEKHVCLFCSYQPALITWQSCW